MTHAGDDAESAVRAACAESDSISSRSTSKAPNTMCSPAATGAFRPKVVVVEALAPYSLAPAWDAWEPLLIAHGYRYALLRQPQSLLRRRGAAGLAQLLATAPAPFDAVLFRDFETCTRRGEPSRSSAGTASGPGRHGAPAAPRPSAELVALLNDRLCRSESLDRPATAATRGGLRACPWIHSTKRMDGRIPPCRRKPQSATSTCGFVATDPFRAACGRISASYAW